MQHVGGEGHWMLSSQISEIEIAFQAVLRAELDLFISFSLFV